MPKIVPALTWRAVAAITREGFTAIGGAPYLYLKVVNNRRYYFLRYRYDKKIQSLCLGKYEDISVAEARKLAREMAASLDQGFNPNPRKRPVTMKTVKTLSTKSEEPKEKITKSVNPLKSQRKGTMPFIEILRKYADVCEAAGEFCYNEKRYLEIESFIRLHIEPILKDTPLDEMDTDLAYAVAVPIFQKHPHTWEKIYSYCRQAFNWALAKKMCSQANPFSKDGPLGILLKPLKNGQRRKENFPALHYSSVPDFFVDLHKARNKARGLGRSHSTYDAIEFAMLTGIRSKMVRYVRWSQINWDDKSLTILEEALKVKKKGEHTVYLSEQAIRLLNSIPRGEGDWVFSSDQESNIQITGNSLTQCFHRIHDEKVKLDQVGWIDPIMSKKKGYPIRASFHGTTRSTLKTWSEEGENRKMIDSGAIEFCLAHGMKDSYGGAYNRSTLEPERRFAMQRWADFCYSALDRIPSNQLLPPDLMNF